MKILAELLKMEQSVELLSNQVDKIREYINDDPNDFELDMLNDLTRAIEDVERDIRYTKSELADGESSEFIKKLG